MTVGTMIERLSKFPLDLEVTITDGYNCYCYRSNKENVYHFTLFVDGGESFVDIGIGGCEDTVTP